MQSPSRLTGEKSATPSRGDDANRKLPLFGRLYLWATHRLYDELAWTYDLAAWIVSTGRWDRWRRLALDYVAMQPVLEVGFGTGELLIQMARRNWRVVGIDPSSAMHRQTAAKMRRRRIVAPRHQGRVQALPYADQAFGAVVATFPAEYIVDPASLAEIHRVLRPGGRLIIAGMVVYRQNAWWRDLSRLVFGDGPSTPVSRFEDLLESAGLRAELILRDDPPWTVPIVVAEKQR
jgi:SAM-dependent methyltransferase